MEVKKGNLASNEVKKDFLEKGLEKNNSKSLEIINVSKKILLEHLYQIHAEAALADFDFKKIASEMMDSAKNKVNKHKGEKLYQENREKVSMLFSNEFKDKCSLATESAMKKAVKECYFKIGMNLDIHCLTKSLEEGKDPIYQENETLQQTLAPAIISQVMTDLQSLIKNEIKI